MKDMKAPFVLVRSGQQTPVLGAQSSQSSAPPSLPYGGGTGPTAPTRTPPPSSPHFSFKVTAYQLFDDMPVKDKLLAKVAEFNADQSVELDAISNLLQVRFSLD